MIKRISSLLSALSPKYERLPNLSACEIERFQAWIDQDVAEAAPSRRAGAVEERRAIRLTEPQTPPCYLRELTYQEGDWLADALRHNSEVAAATGQGADHRHRR